MSKSKFEIFQIVKTHLLTQKVRAGEIDNCMYRGANNTKCAVGCLIPDDGYYPGMEHRDLEDLIIHCTLNGINLPEEITNPDNYSLLRALQFVHDRRDPEDWSQELYMVEDMFRLNKY